MDIFAASALVNAVIATVLGTTVLLHGIRSRMNRSFFLYAVFLATWSLGYFLWRVSPDSEQASFWLRVSMSGTAFIPFANLHFVYAFLGKRSDRAFFFVTLGYSVAFVFSLLAWTTFFLSESTPPVGARFQPMAGQAFPPFLVFWIVYAVYASWILLSALLKGDRDDLPRRQTLFILLGTVIGYVGGATSHLIWFGAELQAYGNVALFVSIVFLAYAVLRYRAFNMKVFATEVTAFLLWIAIGTRVLFAPTPARRADEAALLAILVIAGTLLIVFIRKEVGRNDRLTQLSDSLATANRRLKELDNAKSEFVSIASHQLRTPLGNIRGYLSLILEGSYGKVSSELRDVVERINSVNSHLLELVEDLLNVSRIETGRIQYRFEPARIEEIVSEQVDMFIPVAESRGLSLRLNLPKHPLPELSLDAGKIREAVSNLVDNAIKYTRKGSVTVTVEPHGHDAVRVVVEDTGAGFGSEDREKLFRKFVRSEKTAGMAVSGTGLGLYVGKSFVEAHGGAMTAESEGVGKGARFTIELPLRKAGKDPVRSS